MEHTVEAVMTSEVVTAQPSTPFQELVRLLEQCHISALPVVDDSGRLVGIVSEADLLIKEALPLLPWVIRSAPVVVGTGRRG